MKFQPRVALKICHLCSTRERKPYMSGMTCECVNNSPNWLNYSLTFHQFFLRRKNKSKKEERENTEDLSSTEGTSGIQTWAVMWSLAKSLLRLCGNAAKPSMQIMGALQPGTSFCYCQPVLKRERKIEKGEVEEEAFLCGKFSKLSHFLLLEDNRVLFAHICSEEIKITSKYHKRPSQELLRCVHTKRDTVASRQKVRCKKKSTTHQNYAQQLVTIGQKPLG